MTLAELAVKWDTELAQRELESTQEYQMKILDLAGYEFFPGEIVKRHGRQIFQGLPLWLAVRVCYQNYMTAKGN